MIIPLPPELETTLADPQVQLLLRLVIAVVVALLVIRLRHLIARIWVRAYLVQPHRAPNPERQQTLRGLLSGAVTVIITLALVLFTAGQFVPFNTVLLILGLFSGALGFGLMPIVRSFANGFSLIMEDQFTVGDKVEILGIEGVVEAVSLRVTRLRAQTGELVIIPNGEIITIRNYTRGSFSLASVTIKIDSDQLTKATELLEQLGQEAVNDLPNLLQPWLVISPTGQLGATTELTLVARARYGKGAELRPRLIALVNSRLHEADIHPLD